MTGEKRDNRILIVEDSATQAEKLRYILERNGYGVTVTRNGREALEAIRRQVPSLVISDIIMPEMDGFTLCSRLKGEDETKGIPVILLTSLAESEDVLKGLQSGADNFIVKPYDEKYLLSRIDHIRINTNLQNGSKMEMGVELYFKGERYFINSERKQILDLLLSTYEGAVRKNRELLESREKVEALNEELERKVQERTADLRAEIEERKRTEEELTQYRHKLEELVRERTEELNETVRRLEASNRDLEQFAFVASHDLQEPLRMVAGYMQLLERKYHGKLDEKADTYIAFAVDGSKRMQKLIEGLLSYSRISHGAEFGRVDTNAVFAGAIANLAAAIGESEAVVEAGALPTVRGDEIQLTQLFQNLIGNAVKYRKTDTRPHVRVSAERRGKEWLFSVRDNGIGIDPQYFDRIFHVFQRLHTQDEYQGTGIGLASCKKIVERHHGRIYVESSPGGGSVFYFSIPD